MADGFLGRWSRRKQEVREGRAVPEAPPPPQPSHAVSVRPEHSSAAPAAAEVAPAPAPLPEPTMEDVQALEADADFSPFVRRTVAPEVRNAAMRKLFSDPHFNVMDGLDVYIEDYTQPDPLPAHVLRQMASAQWMGLVRDDSAVQDPMPQQGAPQERPQSSKDVAQSGVCNAFPSPCGVQAAGAEPDPAMSASASQPDHENASLRLQSDDAAERPSPGRSAA